MSFASESRERVRPVLPLSAMVDVLFLLLIFFMTASVFREAETQIPIALPAAEHAAPEDQSALKVRITFDDDGTIYLGDRPMVLAELRDTLAQVAANMPGQAVEIRGDRAGDYGLFITLHDLAREAGFTDIRAATVKPAAEAGR